MRLNRFLAAAGLGSRRSCEELISAGKVSVNGHRISELATRVGPGDDVRVGGKPVRPPRRFSVIAFHKPSGVLTTRRDDRGRLCVFDLLPERFGQFRYVGRLDLESEGLLLLTDDGSMIQRMSHPSRKVEKEYEVVVDKDFDGSLIPRLVRGFPIEPGRARMERVRQVSPRCLRVVLTQGLKRQIRLMLFRFGYEVKRLKRVRVGPVSLGRLKPGAFRDLTSREEAELLG